MNRILNVIAVAVTAALAVSGCGAGSDKPSVAQSAVSAPTTSQPTQTSSASATVVHLLYEGESYDFSLPAGSAWLMHRQADGFLIKREGDAAIAQFMLNEAPAQGQTLDAVVVRWCASRSIYYSTLAGVDLKAKYDYYDVAICMDDQEGASSITVMVWAPGFSQVAVVKASSGSRPAVERLLKDVFSTLTTSKR